MRLYEDTRQKKSQHDNVKDYCSENGIELVRTKLDVGDYMLDLNGKCSVDTKSSLSELSHNLLNAKDHSRFWKEIRRAREQGIKLFILCEHGGKIKSIKDVAQWNDKYSGVSGRTLMNEMYRVSISYGVEFVFCEKKIPQGL